MSAHIPLTPLAPCHQCAIGGCTFCDGDTWDEDYDRPGPCPCWEAGH